MKLSTKGRYGLRAMVDIAYYGKGQPVSITNISSRQNITVRYLEQLLGKLRKAGLIQSIRGAQGGYILAKPADEISVGAILRALEGDLTPVACSEITGDEGKCSGANSCVTKYVWKRINDSIQKTVDSIWLSELVEDNNKMEQMSNIDRPCES